MTLLSPHASLRRVFVRAAGGIAPGIPPAGALNAITDVAGVLVGHVTLIEGDSIRTGATASLPHSGNLYRERVPAGFVVGNGYGKLLNEHDVSACDRLALTEIAPSAIVIANEMRSKQPLGRALSRKASNA